MPHGKIEIAESNPFSNGGRYLCETALQQQEQQLVPLVMNRINRTQLEPIKPFAQHSFSLLHSGH